MPLQLIPPGQRKGNRFFLLRGTYRGRRIEVSTKTTDPAAARRFADEYRDLLAKSRVPEAGEPITFARAVELYKAFRQPAREDMRRLDKLATRLGDREVGELQHADLVAATNELWPHCTLESRNRNGMRPAAAVLHYAAANKWCAYLRIPLFKEKRPATRALDLEAARALVRAAPKGNKRLLLVWLFRHGQRISDALKVEAAAIDLRRRTWRARIGKTDQWTEQPIHAEAFEMLANGGLPDSGRLFPWSTRWGVYRWLRPLASKLGIAFTPHMARHSLGRWLNEAGAGLRTIMDTLGHQDVKSSARYQSTDIEVIRASGRKLERLGQARKKRRRRTAA